LRFNDPEAALQITDAARTSAKSPFIAGTTMGEVFWMDDKIWHKHVILFHQVRTIRGEASHQ